MLDNIFELFVNRVEDRGPYRAGARARELHETLNVADLHADSLMTARDLLKRGQRGQVDIPRLIEGNVALQAFTVVTKTPIGSNINRTADIGDAMSIIARVHKWPRPARRSLKERALYQAHKFSEIARNSGGKLTHIKTARDLAEFLERKKTSPGITSGILGLEGAHALECSVANVDRLFDAGFRMISPTHYFDNEFAGSGQGMRKYGLTPEGRELIRRMDEKKMIIDLAHASEKTIADTLDVTTRPVVVSHTGVRGTCDNSRNLGDDAIKEIARRGGVIGIGYWRKMVGENGIESITGAICHVAETCGVQHVALGSDFDGTITAPFDTSGLVLLTESLMKNGFSDKEVGMIMGGNTIKLLRENLPGE